MNRRELLSKPVDFIRGTPEQRTILAAADPKDNTKKGYQRKRAAKEVSRRLFLQRAAVVGGVTAVGGVGALYELFTSHTPEQQREVYNGRIDQMRGLPLIDEEKYDTIISSLKGSSFPLLQKIADDSRFLYESDTNPDEFPEWVHEDTTPFVITNDGSRTSTANMYIDESLKPGFAFKYTPDGDLIQGHYFNDVSVGIHLGSYSSLVESGPLAEGIFLAKEHISSMLMLRFALDFPEWAQKTNQIHSLTDLQGNPLSPDEANRASMAVALNNIRSDETNAWKVMDSAPIFMLGLAYNELGKTGELSRDSRGLGHFNSAIAILDENNIALDVFNNVVNQWVEEKTTLPPEKVTDKLFQPEVFAAIEKLDDQMYSE